MKKVTFTFQVDDGQVNTLAITDDNLGALHDVFGTLINPNANKSLTGVEIAANPSLVSGLGNDPTLIAPPGVFVFEAEQRVCFTGTHKTWAEWYQGDPKAAQAWMVQNLKAPLTLDKTKYTKPQRERMGWKEE